MTDIPQRPTVAIADRYRIETHLGQGGMARRRGSGGSGGSSLLVFAEIRFTAHRTPHTAR